MWPDFRRRLMDDPEWLDRPVDAVRKGEALVLECRGEPVGFAALTRRPDGDHEISYLFICPGHWGPEATRVLIEALVARATREGAWSVWTETSREAAVFYESNGFTITQGSDGMVTMRRPIHAVVGAA